MKKGGKTLKMMQKRSFKSYLILLVLILSAVESNATHALGMEIFFKWKQDSTYEFTAVFYRNCLPGSAGAPGNIQLRAYAPSLGSSYAAGFSTISLAQLPTTGTLVPPLELEHLFDCIGPVHCVEEYVYRGTWTAPNKAADWMFGGQHCCLSGIFNMAAGEIFAEASLNNLDFPDTVYKTVSPIFHNRRPHTVGIQSDLIYNPAVYPTCQKNQVQISQAVNNLNGDDIRYSFFIPQDAGGVLNTYINGFSFGNPIHSVGPITIDSLTGEINFIADTSTIAKTYLLGVKATAYRNDTVVIGGVLTPVRKQKSYSKRNLSIIIEDSLACVPDTFVFYDTTGIQETNMITLGCSETSFNVWLSPSVFCSSIDSNASHVSLVNVATQNSVSLAKAVPINCNVNGESEGFRLYLHAVLDPGIYHLTFKTGSDGNTMIGTCGDTLGVASDTLIIQILEERGSGIIVKNLHSDSSAVIDLLCGRDVFEFWMTEKFKCSGWLDPTDNFKFYKVNSSGEVPLNITSIGSFCNDGFAQRLQLRMQDGLGPGLYRLVLKDSTHKMRGYCNNAFDTSQLFIRVHFEELDLGPDLQFCEHIIWDTTLNIAPEFRYLSWYSQRFPVPVGSGNSHKIIYPSLWRVEGYYGYSESYCKVEDQILIEDKDCITGIDALSDRSDITLFPNPAGDFIQLNIGNYTGDTHMTISDLKGISVKTIALQSGMNQLELDYLNDGIYTIQVINKGVVIHRQKLLIK